MKELIIEQLGEGLVRLTCKNGRVQDIRNLLTFSEVITKEEEVKFYKAV